MNQGFIPPPLPTQPQHSQVNYNPPGRRRRSMLSGWAALTLIPFAIVECRYGWQLAHIRASSPDFAVSYFGGSVFGGLLISLLIAYIVYRISSRSQFAGSLTFSVIIILFCIGQYREGKSVGRSLDATPISTVPKLHNFTAFEFETAGGWVNIQSSHETNLATLGLSGSTGPEPDGMIAVDAGKPTAELRQTAARLAGANGQILPDPVLVDGIQGLRIETTSSDMSRPKLAVLLPRNGKVYLIMGAGAHGYDVTPDFERVLKTWKWKE